jgi:hypothetical protein
MYRLYLSLNVNKIRKKPGITYRQLFVIDNGLELQVRLCLQFLNLITGYYKEEYSHHNHRED